MLQSYNYHNLWQGIILISLYHIIKLFELKP